MVVIPVGGRSTAYSNHPGKGRAIIPVRRSACGFRVDWRDQRSYTVQGGECRDIPEMGHDKELH
jgi:hypothetical protein